MEGRLKEFQIEWKARHLWVDMYRDFYRLTLGDGQDIRLWRTPERWKSYPDYTTAEAWGAAIDKVEYNCLMKEIHADLLAMLECLGQPMFVQNNEKMEDLVVRLRGLLMQAAAHEPYQEWVESKLGGGADESEAELVEELKADITSFTKFIEQTEQLEDVY